MTGVYRLIFAYNTTGTNDSAHNILGWILQNLRKIESCSIYTLAEETYSSTATISRLVRKLGYQNYHFFQKDIADFVRQYEFHNRLMPRELMSPDREMTDVLLSTVARLLEEMRERLDRDEVDRLIEELHSHDRIALYLFEEVSGMNFLQFDLFMQGKLCESFRNEEEIRAHCKQIDPDSLVLVFSAYHIEHADAKKVVRTLKDRGAKVCFVTDSAHYAVQMGADMKFSLPGVGSGIDMIMIELFLYLVTVKYRRKYCS